VALNDGLDTLLETLRPAASAQDACLLAVTELDPTSAPRDDVAIVALHNQPIPAELRLRLPAEPNVLADLRRQLRRWLRDRGAVGDELLEITMAVSEACANAVEHAYSPAPATFEVRASETDGEVTLTVRDSGRWRPPRGTNRGRGLRIIEAAMDDVTVAATNTGTEITMRRRLSR
jgi:anti-sigma regulatory factor (Ser/Thr protein kinase)